MKRLSPAALCALLLAPANAPARDIATLPIGHYFCEVPGSAQGPATLPRPELDFAITNASSYRADGSGGSYLLRDGLLTMTSGPRRGQRYRHMSANQLRLLDSSGADTAIRCVRLAGTGGRR